MTTTTQPDFQNECAQLAACLLTCSPPPRAILNEMTEHFTDEHGLDFRKYTMSMLLATPAGERLRTFIGLCAIRVLLEEVATEAGQRFRLRDQKVTA